MAAPNLPATKNPPPPPPPPSQTLSTNQQVVQQVQQNQTPLNQQQAQALLSGGKVLSNSSGFQNLTTQANQNAGKGSALTGGGVVVGGGQTVSGGSSGGGGSASPSSSPVGSSFNVGGGNQVVGQPVAVTQGGTNFTVTPIAPYQYTVQFQTTNGGIPTSVTENVTIPTNIKQQNAGEAATIAYGQYQSFPNLNSVVTSLISQSGKAGLSPSGISLTIGTTGNISGNVSYASQKVPVPINQIGTGTPTITASNFSSFASNPLAFFQTGKSPYASFPSNAVTVGTQSTTPLGFSGNLLSGGTLQITQQPTSSTTVSVGNLDINSILNLGNNQSTQESPAFQGIQLANQAAVAGELAGLQQKATQSVLYNYMKSNYGTLGVLDYDFNTFIYNTINGVPVNAAILTTEFSPSTSFGGQQSNSVGSRFVMGGIYTGQFLELEGTRAVNFIQSKYAPVENTIVSIGGSVGGEKGAYVGQIIAGIPVGFISTPFYIITPSTYFSLASTGASFIASPIGTASALANNPYQLGQVLGSLAFGYGGRESPKSITETTVEITGKPNTVDIIGTLKNAPNDIFATDVKGGIDNGAANKGIFLTSLQEGVKGISIEPFQALRIIRYNFGGGRVEFTVEGLSKTGTPDVTLASKGFSTAIGGVQAGASLSGQALRFTTKVNSEGILQSPFKFVGETKVSSGFGLAKGTSVNTDFFENSPFNDFINKEGGLQFQEGGTGANSPFGDISIGRYRPENAIAAKSENLSPFTKNFIRENVTFTSKGDPVIATESAIVVKSRFISDSSGKLFQMGTIGGDYRFYTGAGKAAGLEGSALFQPRGEGTSAGFAFSYNVDFGIEETIFGKPVDQGITRVEQVEKTYAGYTSVGGKATIEFSKGGLPEGVKILNADQAAKLNTALEFREGNVEDVKQANGGVLQARENKISNIFGLKQTPKVTPFPESDSGIEGNIFTGMSVKGGVYNTDLNTIGVNIGGLEDSRLFAKLGNGGEAPTTFDEDVNGVLEHESIHALLNQGKLGKLAEGTPVGKDVADLGYGKDSAGQESFVRGLQLAIKKGGDIYYNEKTQTFTNVEGGRTTIKINANFKPSVTETGGIREITLKNGLSGIEQSGEGKVGNIPFRSYRAVFQQPKGLEDEVNFFNQREMLGQANNKLGFTEVKILPAKTLPSGVNEALASGTFYDRGYSLTEAREVLKPNEQASTNTPMKPFNYAAVETESTPSSESGGIFSEAGDGTAVILEPPKAKTTTVTKGIRIFQEEAGASQEGILLTKQSIEGLKMRTATTIDVLHISKTRATIFNLGLGFKTIQIPKTTTVTSTTTGQTGTTGTTTKTVPKTVTTTITGTTVATVTPQITITTTIQTTPTTTTNPNPPPPIFTPPKRNQNPIPLSVEPNLFFSKQKANAAKASQRGTRYEPSLLGLLSGKTIKPSQERKASFGFIRYPTQRKKGFNVRDVI